MADNNRIITYDLKLANIRYLLFGYKRIQLAIGVWIRPALTMAADGVSTTIPSTQQAFLECVLPHDFMASIYNPLNASDKKIYSDIFGPPRVSDGKNPYSNAGVAFRDGFCDYIRR